MRSSSRLGYVVVVAFLVALLGVPRNAVALIGVGSFDVLRWASDVEVAGSLAFVADDSAGLQVIDVSNPSAPFLRGSIGGFVGVDVAVVGSLAYVVADAYSGPRYSGLQVIDVSNPAAPFLRGSIDTPHGAWDVEVVGSLAFVAFRVSGGLGLLQVIDVSNPAAPFLRGSIDTPGSALDVEVVGSLAYVADYHAGLLVIDVSDPSFPVLRGSIDTPRGAQDIEVVGSLAYVADYHAGLLVIDVSDPSSPVLRGSIDTPRGAQDIEVVGSLAYVAFFENDGLAGLQVIDVSNPGAPFPRGRLRTLGYAQDVEVVGSLAYVADGYALQVIDVSNPAASSFLRGGIGGFAGVDVEVVGSLAYVVADDVGLQVIDVTNPAAPFLRGSIDTPGYPRNVEVVGSLAYVADESGLQVIDVSNPAAPFLRGSIDMPLGALDVEVVGSLAYVANSYGLQVIDVSNPAAPFLRGGIDTPGYALNVKVAGSLAYVADESGLQVIDVSNPSFPVLRGSVDTPLSALDVEVVGSLAYVAGFGLQVIDVSDPSAPFLRGHLDMTRRVAFFRTVVAGSQAFVTSIGDGWGVHVIDVSNPAAPVWRGSLDTPPGWASGVAVLGSLAYVADDSGLQVIELGPEYAPTAPTLTQANPYCDTSPPPSRPAVVLGWTAARGATSYDVYRNGSLYFAGITGTGFQNEINVVGGQTYSYFIRARTGQGTTMDSNIGTVQVPTGLCGGPAGDLALGPPLLVCGGAGIPPSMQLDWSASANASTYAVYRNGALNASGLVGTSYRDAANVVRGVSYTYHVRARSLADFRDSLPVTVAVPPGACALPPGPFVASQPNVDCSGTGNPVTPGVRVDWGASAGASDYEVIRDGSVIASNIAGVSFTDAAILNRGSTHSYSVRAWNSVGFSEAQAGSVLIPHSACKSGVSSTLRYAALGDSYSSGEGAGSYDPSSDVDDDSSTPVNENNKCHRSSNAYPHVSSAHFGTPVGILGHLACSGAVVDNVRNGGQPPQNALQEQAQLDRLDVGDQIAFQSTQTDLVTITIGGNDLGFGQIMTKCLLTPRCDTGIAWSGAGGLVAHVNRKLPALQTRLRDLFCNIRDNTPNASVFVLGYPQIFAGSTGNAGSISCSPNFSVPEQDALRTATDQANATIEAAADAAGVHFAEVPSWFVGHEICGAFSTEWFNNVVARDTDESFHPNSLGHVAYAGALGYTIGLNLKHPKYGSWLNNGLPANKTRALTSCPAPAQTPAAPSPPSSVALVPLGPLFIAAEAVVPCPTANAFVPSQRVRLTATGFSPDAGIELRVTSQDETYQVSLGSVSASGVGDLDVVVSLPDDLPVSGPALVEAVEAEGTATAIARLVLINAHTSFDDDGDADGVPDICDTCRYVSGANQADSDGDGLGDICDAWPMDHENDVDGDGSGRPFDACPLDPLNDVDHDGVCGNDDNCPDIANPAQADIDSDGAGNACDADLNGDSILDASDRAVFALCSGHATGDGVGPPDDPTCEESDINIDGVVDGVDESLFRALFASGGGDWDGDGVADANDNCPVLANPGQGDIDGDALGDACDPDDDADGVLDGADNCPSVANPGQEDIGGMGVGSPPDGIGNACQCGDVNGDGRVTLIDATVTLRSLLIPPTATQLHPELCNVGGSVACTVADATIIRRALLAPPTAVLTQACVPALTP